MAQSAASETTHVQTEAPAQTTTSTNTGHRDPTAPPDDALFNELPPPNPELDTPVSGPAVAPVTDLTLDSSPSSSIPRGNATGAITDDKEDMWLAMAMTFNDFYQGVPEEDKPPLTKTNKTSVPEPSHNNIVELNPLFKETDNPRLDKFRCLFSTPFAE